VSWRRATWFWFSVLFVALLGSRPFPPSLSPAPEGWNWATGRFDWGAGEVTLPPGFRHEFDVGDSVMGHFTSRDGAVVIRYDIGGYAGTYAESKEATQFEERIRNGHRIWIATRPWPDGRGGTSALAAVTFPDAGSANFMIEDPSAQSIAILESIAASFRPTWTPTD
jgi:hypothetical protein